MANYYWVGGTGTWNSTSTTNWASTSGGAGGAGVPTSADNAYFDGSSDTGAAFTVTIGTGAVCADVIIGDGSTVTALDQTMTLAGSTAWNIYGSIFTPATNLTRTFSSTINLFGTGSHTITTNGVNLTSNNTVNAFRVFGSYTLGSALTVGTGGGGIRLSGGSFDTANFNVTTGVIQCDAGSITLGSSTITLNANLWQIASSVTLSAGTSTINMVNTGSPFFFGGGKTYYDVNFGSGADGITRIHNENTFNNAYFTSRGSVGRRAILLFDNQIVNGTLTLGNSNSSVLRMFVFSSVVGTQRTITLNGTLATLNDVDFRDIKVDGTVATPWTGTRLGDCGGNSDITFDAPKIVYRIGTGNWSATQWSDSSGGAAATQWFPLAQDTMVFDANTTTGTHTIDNVWNLGTLNMTNSTAVTLASGTTTPSFYGDIILSNNVTPTGTGLFSFIPRTGVTMDITSSGKSFDVPLTVDGEGAVKLVDNFTTGITGTVTLTQGTINLNDQSLTAGLFSSNNAIARSIAFGSSGKIILKGTGTVWTTADPTNFSVSGAPVVDVDNNTATATTVTTGALSEANSISFNYISGTYTLTDTAAVYRNLNFTGFGGTVLNSVRTLYGGLTLEGGATNSAGANATTFAATSGTHQITTDGVTVNYPLIFNGNGGTFEFQDALTQSATRAFTITNGTVELKDGVTTTVGSFGTSGSNQKFLRSTTAGVQATLSQASGTVSVSNLAIQDINATGGATWLAYTTNGNEDDGNNDGWDFSFQTGRYIYTRRKNKRILP
jgi:hypothetical protein